MAFVTAALLGQHALPADTAKVVADKLDLGEDAARLLQTIPLRGSIPGGVPTDPTIYRFYEMVQVYGSTLKALVHEKFGDGIISAINFKLDIKKVEDPGRSTPPGRLDRLHPLPRAKLRAMVEGNERDPFLTTFIAPTNSKVARRVERRHPTGSQSGGAEMKGVAEHGIELPPEAHSAQNR